MAKVTQRHLDDRVEIEFTLRKPRGEDDERKLVEIRYADLSSLNPMPRESELPFASPYEIVEVEVPDDDRKVAYIVGKYFSNGQFPEETLHGPYLLS